jgi:hypothetical protein
LHLAVPRTPCQENCFRGQNFSRKRARNQGFFALSARKGALKTDQKQTNTDHRKHIIWLVNSPDRGCQLSGTETSGVVGLVGEAGAAHAAGRFRRELVYLDDCDSGFQPLFLRMQPAAQTGPAPVNRARTRETQTSKK